MVKFYFLAISAIAVLGMFLWSVTFAAFTDTASASANTFTAASVFPSLAPSSTPTETPTPTGEVTPSVSPTVSPTVTPTPPLLNHLVINEIFQASTNPLEWVELYNPTDSEVNVTGWKIADSGVGSSDTFPTTSPIPAGGFAVIVTNASTVSGIPSSAITITLTNATIGGGLNTDGDSVKLLMPNDTEVDSLSYGTDTSVFSPAAPVLGLTQSLSRIPNISDTNTSSDWILDNTPSIGVAN